MRKYCLIILFLVTLGMLTAKTYYVKDFVSTINVNTDGSLDIEESMQYHFDGGPFKWISRDVRAPKDGFIVLEKALQDDNLVPLGKEVGNISVKKSDDLKVKLFLDSISDQILKVTLNYKVFNALEADNKKAVLRWTPTPDNYNFLIKSGKITINFPAHIASYDIVSFLKEVKNVSYEEKGHSLICSFKNLKGKSFEIRTNLPLEAMELQTYPSPRKGDDLFEQHPELRQYADVYKLLIALVIIFLIAVIVILISRYNKQMKNLPKITSLPSHKHPALVARLLQVGSDDINLIPVLMLMAIKKLISFTQVTDKKDRAVKDYYIDIAEDLSKADEFDLGYLAILRKEEQRKNKRIQLKALVSNSYRYRKDLLKLINEKFVETGFVDIQKKKAYYRKIFLFFVLLIAGVSATIIGGIFFTKGFALAPLPAFLIVSYWIYLMLHLDEKVILSQRGLEKWKEWRSFTRYIGKAIHPKSNDLNPNDAEDLFPYVLIMGYGEEYLHYFKKKNIELNFPNLGEIASDIESLTTLITIIVMTSATHGGSAGGSAGGGGGGASAG